MDADRPTTPEHDPTPADDAVLELRLHSLTGLAVPAEPPLDVLERAGAPATRRRAAIVGAAAAAVLVVGGAVAVGARGEPRANEAIGVAAGTPADGSPGTAGAGTAPVSAPDANPATGPHQDPASGGSTTVPGSSDPTTPATPTTASTAPGGRGRPTTTATTLRPSTDPGGQPPRSNPLPETTVPPTTSAFPEPPPLQLIVGSATTELSPWTICWAMMCADGLPPDDPDSVGSPDAVVVRFAADNWRFEARFLPPDAPNSEGILVDLERIGAHDHRLVPTVPPGTYDVTISGWAGPGATERGDIHSSFRWTVT